MVVDIRLLVLNQRRSVLDLWYSCRTNDKRRVQIVDERWWRKTCFWTATSGKEPS